MNLLEAAMGRRQFEQMATVPPRDSARRPARKKLGPRPKRNDSELCLDLAVAIALQVAEERGASLMAVQGPCRVKKLVECRTEIAARLRRSGWTLREIGKFLGGRNHSTVKVMLGRAEQWTT